MGTVIPQTKYEALPAGVYRAKVGAVALEDGTFGPQLKFRFDVVDGDEAGKSVTGWASPKLSAGKKPSKLYGWCAALLFGGKALPEEYTLDTDDLLDREGLLVLDIQEKEAGSFNKVTSILPLRRNGSKAPAPAPAPAGRMADPNACRNCGADFRLANAACAEHRNPNAQPPAVMTRAAAGGVVVNQVVGTVAEPGWLTDDGEGVPF